MEILIENQQQKQAVNLEKLQQISLKILSVLECPDETELSILIVDDAAIQEINREYLQRDHPTNVISFSQQEGEMLGGPDTLLGDVVISAETAARDAAEAGIEMFDELVFLLLHGILHLLGYDHERGTQAEAERMEAKEQQVYALLKAERLILEHE